LSGPSTLAAVAKPSATAPRGAITVTLLRPETGSPVARVDDVRIATALDDQMLPGVAGG